MCYYLLKIDLLVTIIFNFSESWRDGLKLAREHQGNSNFLILKYEDIIQKTAKPLSGLEVF